MNVATHNGGEVSNDCEEDVIRAVVFGIAGTVLVDRVRNLLTDDEIAADNSSVIYKIALAVDEETD